MISNVCEDVYTSSRKILINQFCQFFTHSSYTSINDSTNTKNQDSSTITIYAITRYASEKCQRECPLSARSLAKKKGGKKRKGNDDSTRVDLRESSRRRVRRRGGRGHGEASQPQRWRSRRL